MQGKSPPVLLRLKNPMVTCRLQPGVYKVQSCCNVTEGERQYILSIEQGFSYVKFGAE